MIFTKIYFIKKLNIIVNSKNSLIQNFKKMKIITGGAGMIGSNLIKLLHEKKYDLFIIDNLWRGKLENISDKISDKNFF